MQGNMLVSCSNDKTVKTWTTLSGMFSLFFYFELFSCWNIKQSTIDNSFFIFTFLDEIENSVSNFQRMLI